VTAVDNGEDGAAVAAREVPDVVLLDVMMPGLDGEGTARLLRTNAATADVPVVLLTASTHRPAWADELGVVGVIAKPFDPTTLAAELDRLLGG
jgi:CheY-like chemotaxis protein